MAVLCSILLLACSKQLDTLEGFSWEKAKSKHDQRDVYYVVIAKTSLIIQIRPTRTRPLPLFASRIVQSGCYELARCSMSVLSNGTRGFDRAVTTTFEYNPRSSISSGLSRVGLLYTKLGCLR